MLRSCKKNDGEDWRKLTQSSQITADAVHDVLNKETVTLLATILEEGILRNYIINNFNARNSGDKISSRCTSGHVLLEKETLDLLIRELPDGDLKTAVTNGFETKYKDFIEELYDVSEKVPGKFPRAPKSSCLPSTSQCRVM